MSRCRLTSKSRQRSFCVAPVDEQQSVPSRFRARGSAVEEQPVLIQPSNGSAGCSGNQQRREGAWNPRHLVALSAQESAAGVEGPQPPGPAVLPQRLHLLMLRSHTRILKEFGNSPVVQLLPGFLFYGCLTESGLTQPLRKHGILVIWKNFSVLVNSDIFHLL